MSSLVSKGRDFPRTLERLLSVSLENETKCKAEHGELSYRLLRSLLSNKSYFLFICLFWSALYNIVIVLRTPTSARRVVRR